MGREAPKIALFSAAGAIGHSIAAALHQAALPRGDGAIGITHRLRADGGEILSQPAGFRFADRSVDPAAAETGEAAGENPERYIHGD